MDHLTVRRWIERKRHGGELSAQDWHDIVDGYMSGEVDDAQMAALCMACVLRGMTFDEAHALTDAMVHTGAVLSFDRSRGTVVDKHSSGGVSDIVSLVAVPLAAAAGARVAKLSGRALGHTGGTIDKLETIPGFNVSLELHEFTQQVERIGCAIAAQTETIVPADKRLYHLRDRTASVPAMGLIAASIVSKKIAGGAHAFVFDVKTGAAAFMQDPNEARELANWLVQISQRFGRRARAFVTDMNQPLGRSIGTGIEVIEARELLRASASSSASSGHVADERTREFLIAIAGVLVEEAGVSNAHGRVRTALENGSAYVKFVEMIAAQKGDTNAFERMALGEASVITSSRAGYVSAIDVVTLGHAGRRLSAHDPLGGLRVAVRIGDRVEIGQPLLYAYGHNRADAHNLEAAFTLSESPVQPPPLVYDTISSS